mmetsp:Transcript_34242/g.62962  ORF Transcript_34242/g.62962 Transcript_34242/m.62962 type:complete len:233 (+) Transcript_34242:275-973(+)
MNQYLRRVITEIGIVHCKNLPHYSIGDFIFGKFGNVGIFRSLIVVTHGLGLCQTGNRFEQLFDTLVQMLELKDLFDNNLLTSFVDQPTCLRCIHGGILFVAVAMAPKIMVLGIAWWIGLIQFRYPFVKCINLFLFRGGCFDCDGGYQTAISFSCAAYRVCFAPVQQEEEIGHLPCKRMADNGKAVRVVPNSMPMPGYVGMRGAVKRTVSLCICLPSLFDVLLLGTMLREHAN